MNREMAHGKYKDACNLAAALIFLLFFSHPLEANVFDAEGSDLLMGVGAKEIARGGAAVAKTNDIYSIFWNPAGLSEITAGEMSLSTQADGDLSRINFFGIAYAFPLEEIGIKISFAFAYIPRLYMKASGEFRESDFESVFLRYTLPGLSGNFDGKIDSKTDDLRVALAVSPLKNRFWSLGFSIASVNCATTFGGVTMEDPTNFQSVSTIARAVSFGIGAKYYANESLTFGLNIKNIDSTLTVAVDRIDKSGYTHNSYEVEFPIDLTFGANWKLNDVMDLAMDYQQVYGAYGDYNIDFRTLRMGTSIDDDSLSYHVGAIIPLKLASDKLEQINLRIPLAPTAGMGWHNDTVDVSFAFYFHPIISHQKGSPSPSLDVTVGYKF
ncbi:hypothetical protein KKG72_09230 [bacterium]|nr:hypothetical protein [bacterium]MBU1995051.1 hypothetical protein [bacterium]